MNNEQINAKRKYRFDWVRTNYGSKRVATRLYGAEYPLAIFGVVIITLVIIALVS